MCENAYEKRRGRSQEGPEGKNLRGEGETGERRCVPSVFRGKRADYNKCIKTRKSGSVVVLVVNF